MTQGEGTKYQNFLRNGNPGSALSVEEIYGINKVESSLKFSSINANELIGLRNAEKLKMESFLNPKIDKMQAVNGIEKTTNLNTTHRLTMGKNKFDKFVQTIKNEGIKEPIKYVEYNGKKYVVDGHHRLQAAKRVGIEVVPVEKVELPYLGYKNIEDLLWGD